MNSQTAGMIADDKFAMYEILKFHKINVIEHVLIWNRNNSYLDIEEKIMFLKKYFHDHNNHIVLKPNMGYGGKMVFNITQEDEIKNIFLKLINYTNTIVLNPFYEIKNMYPKYLFTSDVLLQNRDGVINVNIADFIYNNKEL